MELKGVHHITAITSSVEKIYDFFTYTLGMRLVKKTVNQDDIQTYHLFFTDDIGSPGTDMTFFDFPGIPKERHGTNEIYQTSFRVPDDRALQYWVKRFDRLQVKHGGIKEKFGKKVLPFVDFDDQQYQLISDEHNEGVKAGTPWKNGPIPLEFAVIGLGPVFVRVDNIDFFKQVLEKVLRCRLIDQDGDKYLYEMGEGGNGAQIIAEHNIILPPARQGYGTVHHAVFRVDNKKDLDEWDNWIKRFGFPTSGFVDRFFFDSLYVNVAPQILLNLLQMGLALWVMSHMKHSGKNYLYRHF